MLRKATNFVENWKDSPRVVSVIPKNTIHKDFAVRFKHHLGEISGDSIRDCIERSSSFCNKGRITGDWRSSSTPPCTTIITSNNPNTAMRSTGRPGPIKINFDSISKWREPSVPANKRGGGGSS
ncbi:unnamed protein product [Prunus brigantina]